VSQAVAAIAIEDLALVEQTQQGDMAAFARLVSKYQDRVYNTCWRLCGHAEDARDLTQEAFLHALRAIDAFRGKAGFYTWLFRIAVNLSISHRRREQRTVKLSLRQDDDAHLLESQAGGLVRGTRVVRNEDPAGQAEMREAHRAVIKALDELDDEYRAVLVLKDVESFDYQQIAEILEIPIGTVKSRIHRARMAMREKLTRVLEGGQT